jgi:AsmA protein
MADLSNPPPASRLRVLKITLVAAGALAVLAGAGIAMLAASFDPNAYKPLLIERVQQDKQRTLAIPGPIKLSFFPKLGLEIGAVSLSERASAAPFASVQSARVSLALLPLLRRQVVIDRVQVQGLRASLRRFKDGRTNVDDLLAAAPQDGGARPQPLQFDIAGVDVGDAAITFDDELTARRIDVARGSIRSGRIAPGTPVGLSLKAHVKASQPALDADLSAEGALLLDPEGRRLQLSDVQLKAGGRAGEGLLEAALTAPQLSFGDKNIAASKIDAQFSLKQGPRVIKGRLAVPSIEGAMQAFKVASIAGELKLDDGPLQASAALSGALEGNLATLRFHAPLWTLTVEGRKSDTVLRGTVSTPWRAELDAHLVELGRIAAELQLSDPKGGVLGLRAAGTARARLDQQRASAELSGHVDKSAFEARLALNRFSPADYAFELDLDQLDADRYRAWQSGAAGEKGPPASGAPIDLSALKGLDARGSVRVGALQLAGLKMSQVRFDLRAAGGRLDIAPLMARLYQGSVAGAVSVTASSPPSFTIRQTLSDISVGPLLKDLAGIDRLDGRGKVVLDLGTQGATIPALEKALGGQVQFDLREGAVRGINVAQVLRTAKAALGGAGAPQGSGSPAEKTDFSEVSGSFRIANGVARNDDLQAKSPLLRVAGSGAVDLVQARLDYLLKASVVATLQGQGGPELQALRGQTLPVRLAGPFDKIGYSVDVAAAAQDIAKQKLEKKLKDELPQGLGDKLKGLFGR